MNLVQTAVKEWIAALVDLGGRNNLLHYRDLKLGTLDVTAASSSTLVTLLQGKAIRVSSLFTDQAQREDGLRRARIIYNKAKEYFEERGVETLSLGCGLATWENKRSPWEPSAPVLLRRALLRPLGAAQDEFELSLLDEMEVNPTLLHVLKTDFDCGFNHDALLDRVDGQIDEPWELQETYAWLEEQVTRVPGFRIDPRLILTNFAYVKLPMVRDLEQAFNQLLDHPLIGALAGDEECREAIRQSGPPEDAIPRIDQTPLANEFLVLDADSSQNYAINSVLAEQSLLVKGPPGTGKSQTIANLIASLIATEKKVLFVAEKRAAIDAVTKRLNQQGLGDLVLDLHGRITNRRAFAQAIKGSLAANRTALRVDNDAELRDLEKRRRDLNAYASSLHRDRDPWGTSVYLIRAQLFALEPAQNQIRFRDQALQSLGGPEARAVEESLAEYARLGGLTMASSDSAWARSTVVSLEEVQQVYGLVDEIHRRSLPAALDLVGRGSAETGLEDPETLAECSERVALWRTAEQVLTVFTPAVYELDLDSSCVAFGAAGGGGLGRLRATMTSASFRSARREVRSARVKGRKVSDPELYLALKGARDSLAAWGKLTAAIKPRVPTLLVECEGTVRHLVEQVERLESWIDKSGLLTMATLDVRKLVERLTADQATLVRRPQLHQLEASMVSVGLRELLDEMKARQASEEFAIASFRYSWLRSILDHLSLADPIIAGFVAEKHDRTALDFRHGDRAHIETTSRRIRRLCAEMAVRARDQFKDQAALVDHQAGLKRRHLPIRDFFRNAPEVLLALKPCWAMSPLMVSQILPPKPYFDVVIFDEASQVTPADAVPSILRGRQLVVAGDDKQLPPSAFFVGDSPDEEENATSEAGLSELLAGTKGFESILDALGPLLRFRMLLWHYRSRDERLIAFSNAHLYDRMLTTFAGIGAGQVLRHVQVPWEAGADTNSPAPEVKRVVDLMLDHAREHPGESLGVIAMGVKHSKRIEDALYQRLRADPALTASLGDFFDESREERFFVKNLERVQGDERDAIILSVGYGKNAHGDLPYRFGPLLTEGGERRLNVAVTRAKGRVTLVSSFSYDDMDPDRSEAEGVKLLRQYLEYVVSDGVSLGDSDLEKPALNPFEVDVRDTLARRGLKLTAQYGSSGYWIDFAVKHPFEPGRYVLAIECDGATYHSSGSARDRDRLRQEQLERIGWRFHRIWSSEWFYNKAAAVDKVIAAYDRAVSDSDGHGAPVVPEPPNRSITGASDADTPASIRVPRPFVASGQSVVAYSDFQLLQMVRWVESDKLLRTEEELLEEVMRALGFRRRGKNVVARLTAAIRQSHAAKWVP
ncbi:MAG TPA: AAA domain-containing protein [Candidatus Dormibacteraeota bacterium]|nr:AAA domain-containing protein [Candidatus Dormibacteraeota bacterium]